MFGVGEVMGSILIKTFKIVPSDAPIHNARQAIENIIIWLKRMPWPEIKATPFFAQLGLPYRDRALVPLDQLNGLALRCYQQSLEV